ncbi:thiamine pyrophosphate-dependent enzyme [Brevibacterium oceani]|uniref:thiamine pyrophosphate-dependent enzyme n=1 Tax=Brevibacterium oceani TaxID=358099 RepID=UPI0015E7DE46|nr:thiamine pyrophosphate-dependent enzyme [Brevibacterium oceani]
MSDHTRKMAGHAIVEQLAYGGVTRVFGVPGESYLGVLDGLYEHRDSIDMIVARQEGGAAMMAAASGRISGRPGVCMVTRGPGATNASIGVHVARQDASPMILFIGQVPRYVAGREAFQEIDYQSMFAPVAKEVLEINRPERAGEIVSRALLTSMSGEPGPIVVVLPEDVLTTEVEDTVYAIESPPEPGPHPTGLAEVVSMLESAERPIIVLGRQADHNACELLQNFAERSSIPIVTTVRSQDLIDNESAVYAGTLGLNTTPGLEQRVSRADVIVFLGTRPDALSTASLNLYSDESAAGSVIDGRIVHVHPSAEVLERGHRVDLRLVSSAAQFIAQLPVSLAVNTGRRRWFAEMRESCVAARAKLAADGTAAARFMRVFDQHVASDAILTVGAGNYTAWAQRYRRYREHNTQLGTESGAMGYGIPAAIAAAFESQGRPVVAFAGDGCLLMNGQELATITRYDLDVLVIVVNNGRFGTIREHQERRYPDRTVGTDLVNPDFVRFAESFGARAQRVESPDAFGVALSELYPRPGLRLIEVRVD